MPLVVFKQGLLTWAKLYPTSHGLQKILFDQSCMKTIVDNPIHLYCLGHTAVMFAKFELKETKTSGIFSLCLTLGTLTCDIIELISTFITALQIGLLENNSLNLGYLICSLWIQLFVSASLRLWWLICALVHCFSEITGEEGRQSQAETVFIYCGSFWSHW